MKSYMIPSLFFLNIVNYIKFVFKEAFTHLGLLKPPPPEADYHSGEGYILLTDSRSRSIVLVPVQVLTTIIKDNLPVLRYGDFIERFGHHEDDEQAKKDNNGVMICSVCLDSIERSDEIRELCMCSHVFHKECIDTWVDEGRVTCPLCRSTLYPEPMNWPARAGSTITDYDVGY